MNSIEKTETCNWNYKFVLQLKSTWDQKQFSLSLVSPSKFVSFPFHVFHFIIKFCFSRVSTTIYVLLHIPYWKSLCLCKHHSRKKDVASECFPIDVTTALAIQRVATSCLCLVSHPYKIHLPCAVHNPRNVSRLFWTRDDDDRKQMVC